MAGDRRIASLRRLAGHVAEVAPVDLSLRLWDGSILPLAPAARSDVVVAIATPAALTRLMRRPRLTTVVELIAEGAVDLEGGTLLDLSARLGGGSTRGLARRIDKVLAARALLPFLFGPGLCRHAGREAWRRARRQGAGAIPLRPVE